MSGISRFISEKIHFLAWNIADINGDFDKVPDYEERIWDMYGRFDKALNRLAAHYGWTEAVAHYDTEVAADLCEQRIRLERANAMS